MRTQGFVGLLLVASVLAVASTAGSARGDSSSPYASAVSADSPYLWWHLDETAGSPSGSDATGHGYGVTFASGATLGTPGALNGQTDTSLTAAGGGGSASDAPDTAAGSTVEFWFQNTTPPSTSETLMTANGGSLSAYNWSIALGSDGTLTATINESNGKTTRTLTGPTGALADSNWHLIDVILNGASSAIYVDGDPGATGGTTVAGPCASKCSDNQTNPSLGFGTNVYGAYDEIALYATPLNQSQIVLHYDGANPWGDSSTDPSQDPADPTPTASAPASVAADTDPGVVDPPVGTTNIDRQAIVDYALQYVGTNLGTDSTAGWNNTQYPGPPSNDCQDFVSQSLRAGGWPDDMGPPGADLLTGTNVWWYQDPPDHSYSWMVASYFWRYAEQSGRGTYVSYWSDVQPGDVVMVDWNGTHHYPTHSMVVTATATTQTGIHQVYLTYHTTDRKNMPITTLRRLYPHATWWAFHIYDQF